MKKDDYNRFVKKFQPLKDNGLLFLKKRGQIIIKFTAASPQLPKFGNMAEEIYFILDHFESAAAIRLENFPYCAVSEQARDHIAITRGYRGEKSQACRKCSLNSRCGGFPQGYFHKYGRAESRTIADRPAEVMIEIESRCNLNCYFCFNRLSFARRGRNIENKLTAGYAKKIIDEIKECGIKTIRFTGGEPLLRKDIFELLSYAKRKGLKVDLNTNGTLIDAKTAHRLKGLVDEILIPIESWEDRLEDNITGGRKSLTQKKKALMLLDKAKIPYLRAGTVITQINIQNFDKLAKVVLDLPIAEWDFYWPVSPVKKTSGIKRSEAEELADKIIRAAKKTDIIIRIGNATPFCLFKDKNKLNSICAGAIFDEQRRLAIDPRGFVKPHYFFDKNIGSPLRIKEAWNHPIMKKIRDPKNLPKKCQDCSFVNKCAGGRQVSN